jgi:hypothetical protein
MPLGLGYSIMVPGLIGIRPRSNGFISEEEVGIEALCVSSKLLNSDGFAYLLVATGKAGSVTTLSRETG